MSSSVNVERKLKEKIAGETVLSDEPGGTLKKWRKDFGIAQNQLSEVLDVSSSVISDYEGGRRDSPGTGVIKGYIQAMMEIDRRNGSRNIRRYRRILGAGFEGDAVKELKEYQDEVPLDSFLGAIKARTVRSGGGNAVRGYTLIDSVEAISSLSHTEFTELYGWSTDRALIFTDINRGESPLVAIRVTQLKPNAVVFHGIHETRLSDLAPELAEAEDVHLSITNLPLDDIKDSLRSLDVEGENGRVKEEG
ncbi:MAG: helix-turn-helix domain-containing protein [Halobacteria archaeon]